jgi:hypothetical protein
MLPPVSEETASQLEAINAVNDAINSSSIVSNEYEDLDVIVHVPITRATALALDEITKF